MQTCIWPSWCHCQSLSLASVKSIPFWYRLTRVVPDKGVCVCVCVCVSVSVTRCYSRLYDRLCNQLYNGCKVYSLRTLKGITGSVLLGVYNQQTHSKRPCRQKWPINHAEYIPARVAWPLSLVLVGKTSLIWMPLTMSIMTQSGPVRTSIDRGRRISL